MMHQLTTTFGLAVIGLCTGSLAAADAPRVLELRTQKVEGVTYFQVRVERPADLRLPVFDTSKPFSEGDRRKFAVLPRLVSQDGKTRAVYYRHRPTQPGLTFCGLLTGEGKAELLLLYPTREAPPEKQPTLGELVRKHVSIEAPMVLDFGKAVKVPVPVQDRDDQHIHRDDLRSAWALHQGAHFAMLETQVLDFPFYSFAREATSRKYGVVAPAWVRREVSDAPHRLYEITTGADALTETLQLHRLMHPDARPIGERTVPIGEVGGITTPEQPWDRLLGDKKPKTEVLAGLVPQDNYYVYFNDFRKFLEFGELLDQWGTNILRVYEMKSRDYQLRERYEKQLCLKSTGLGKLLGPALVKGVAVTGNDPYVKEGSDVTVIFHVRGREQFLAVVEPFLQEARKEFGKGLREQKSEHRGIAIESFVTAHREVSLHRASFDEFVVYANSPVALRRVLDCHAGKGKALAESPDFRYMRTLFETGDKAEDGLVFLSDAFIRQLTGPVSRIKEKRRLEALTSLFLLTNSALFAAWETGKLPADHAAALAATRLKPEEVAMPEGNAARWDAQRQMAVSDAYNTIHFATPLIELPLDKVTPGEATDYARFRTEYAKLWQTYFDPVGLRVSLNAKRVQVELHMLPLASTEQYRTLRQLTGGGKMQFEPNPSALLDFQLSIGPGKEMLSLHLGGGNVLRDMVELLIRYEEGAVTNPRQDYDKLFWKLPVGVGINSPMALQKEAAEQIVALLKQAELLDGEPRFSNYKDVQLSRLPIHAKKYREILAMLNAFAAQQNELKTFAPILASLPTEEAPEALHVAVIDKALHITPNEEFLKKQVDEAAARKKNEDKKPPATEREANAGLAINLANAPEAVSLFLEYEGHNLALLNTQAWNSFYQTGLLAADANETSRKNAARKFLGYLPVSADATTYAYNARLGEVINDRHGSHRRPILHTRVADGSELRKLLDDIKSLRAELQFLENGLHTVLTIERR